jgi:hypothetical protein
MSVSIRMVRAAAITGGGPSQTFTVAGWTETPKAAMFVMTNATVNGTDTAGAALMVGIATGAANRFCIASSSQDATVDGNSNTVNRKSNTKCISFLRQDGVLSGEADFTSFGVGGVTVTWSSFPSATFLVTVILFAGTDLSAYAGDFLATSDFGFPNTPVTDPNFPPDQLILLCGGHTVTGALQSAYNTNYNGALMQIGFANRQGAGITQCCGSWLADDDARASLGHNYVSTSRASVGTNSVTSPQLGQNAIAITAFSGTGFTATAQIAALAVRYPYLALSYTSGSGTCGHSTYVASSPLATDNQVHDIQGAFTPQFVLQLTGSINIVDAERTAGTTSSPGAGSYALAAFTATEVFSNLITDDDANSSMDTASFSYDTTFRSRFDDHLLPQPNTHVATFVSFAPGQYTLNYTVASSATARRWPTMVVGEFVAGGPTTHLAQATLSSVFSVTASPRAIFSGQASLASVFAASPVGRMTLGGQATLNPAFSLTVNGLATRQASASLASNFSVSAGSTIVLSAQAALAPVFAITPTATRNLAPVIHEAQSSLECLFSIVADSVAVYSSQSSLASEFSCSGTSVLVHGASTSLACVFSVTPTTTLEYAVTAVLASEFVITPAAAVTYITQADVSSAFALSAIAFKVGEEPVTWNSYGIPRLYRSANNAGLTFGLQVNMRATAGQVNARLYNLTDGQVVAGSELLTVSPTFENKTTGPLTLSGDKRYIVQLARSPGGVGEAKSAVPAVVN